MKTIVLRFGENFAPECGTIQAHQDVINKIGYVWYGKLGNKVSKKVQNEIMSNGVNKILLIKSGKTDKYWGYISEIKNETPVLNDIPEYYRNDAEKFKTWFKIIKFEIADKDVLTKYVVDSSNTPLGEVSRKSMSPYFIIREKIDDIE